MKLTHTVNDVEVFDIESLYVLGERVVVGTLACFEILRFVFLFELGSGVDDGVDLLLHGDYLVVGFDVTACFEVLTELALDELGLALGIKADVAV